MFVYFTESCNSWKGGRARIDSQHQSKYIYRMAYPWPGSDFVTEKQFEDGPYPSGDTQYCTGTGDDGSGGGVLVALDCTAVLPTLPICEAVT